MPCKLPVVMKRNLKLSSFVVFPREKLAIRFDAAGVELGRIKGALGQAKRLILLSTRAPTAAPALTRSQRLA